MEGDQVHIQGRDTRFGIIMWTTCRDGRGGAQECFQFQWIGIDENGMFPVHMSVLEAQTNIFHLQSIFKPTHINFN